MPRNKNNSRYDQGYKRNDNNNKRDNKTTKNNEDNAPNNSIMFRGLKLSTTENSLLKVVQPFGFVTNTKILRDNNGESKGIGFADFTSIEEATRFLETYRTSQYQRIGRMTVDGAVVEIKYSRSKQEENWICSSCNGMNYPRRTECWTCKLPRNAAEDSENQTIARAKCATLSVWNLNPLTSKNKVMDFFCEFYPVKSCRLLWDKDKQESRCSAFVEFYTIEDAEAAAKCTKDAILDGFPLRIAFANYNNSDTPRNRSHIAVQALQFQAQYQYQGDNNNNNNQQDNEKDENNSSNIQQSQITDGSTIPVGSLGVPDEQEYIFDQTKGGYFNPKTNFYYDSNSGYFYETTTGFYYYFDSSKNEYIQYNSSMNNTTTIQSDKQQIKPSDIIEKVQENIKIKQQQTSNKTTKPVSISLSSKKSKIRNNKVLNNINKWKAKAQEFNKEDEKIQILTKIVPSSSSPLQINETESNSNQLDIIISKLKEKYEIKTGVVCLLCKRKLPSTEKLLLHYQMSALHTKQLMNMAIQLTKKRKLPLSKEIPSAKIQKIE